jgi:hypothetical protein
MKERLLALGLIAAWVAGCAAPGIATSTPTMISASVTSGTTSTAAPTNTLAPAVTPTDKPLPTSIPTVTMTPIQAEQFEAIKAIFPDYDGPQNVCLSDEVDIHCDSHGQIFKMNISFNGLASLPPEIGRLSNLEYLWVDGNELSTLPPETGQLTKLQFLGLANNPMTSLPSQIGTLSNLDTIQLSGDQMGLLADISRAPNLQTLFILPAGDTTILPPEIGMLTTLTGMKINNIGLKEIPPEFGHLTNLRTVDMSANLLTTLPLEMAQLTNLSYLNLSANPITSLPPEICFSLKSVIHPSGLCN